MFRRFNTYIEGAGHVPIMVDLGCVTAYYPIGAKLLSTRCMIGTAGLAYDLDISFQRFTKMMEEYSETMSDEFGTGEEFGDEEDPDYDSDEDDDDSFQPSVN